MERYTTEFTRTHESNYPESWRKFRAGGFIVYIKLTFKSFEVVSCTTQTGLSELKKLIVSTGSEPVFHEQIPSSWIRVISRLVQLRNVVEIFKLYFYIIR